MHYVVAPPVDSPSAWDELQGWLPEMLTRLLDSELYNRARRPPSGERGIYLFSEGAHHLYVGRTSITARARLASAPPTTSFRARFDQHTQAGRPPNRAPFAMRLALTAANAAGIALPPSDWWERRAEYPELLALFTDAKRRIGDDMRVRIVAFEDDILGVRSQVAEIYAHAMLGTQYNDFSTS
jgi:hypothetical protein